MVKMVKIMLQIYCRV